MPETSDGRLARSLETRERILLTAERLFAELGIANVSLRDISAAAGQKNIAAVQYHFGNRDNLVHEISVFRVRQIEEKRAKLLSKLVLARKPATVREYVKAFVLSLASALDEGNNYLRFLSRFVIDNGGKMTRGAPESTLVTMRGVMRELLPGHSEEIIEERWYILTMSAVHVLAAYQVADNCGALRRSQRLDDLVTVLTAGLCAKPPMRAR